MKRKVSVQEVSTQEKTTEKVDYQEVARVAYGFYEQRGREDGHDLEDWLKAEEIVHQKGTPNKS